MYKEGTLGLEYTSTKRVSYNYTSTIPYLHKRKKLSESKLQKTDFSLIRLILKTEGNKVGINGRRSVKCTGSHKINKMYIQNMYENIWKSNGTKYDSLHQEFWQLNKKSVWADNAAYIVIRMYADDTQLPKV